MTSKKNIKKNENTKKKQLKIQHNGITKHKDTFLHHKGGDNIYFNATIYSDFFNSASESVYNITRDSFIIEKASDYYLSVLRFSIPAYYAPLGSFVTIPGSKTEGVYSITMEYEGYFTPRIRLQITNTGVINNYFKNDPILLPTGGYIYYIYSYERFVYSFNNALIQAYDNLINNYPPEGLNPLPPGKYPFISFEGVTKLFTLWVPQVFLNAPENVNPVNIFLNEYLWELFGSLPGVRINQTKGISNNGRDYVMTVQYNGTNLNYPDEKHRQDGELLYELRQEYITLFNWNPFSRILLTTSLLPIRDEYIRGNGDSVLKIITDFIPSNDVVEVRSTFQYFSRGQYRLVDLVSDKEIRHIDLGVSWEDKLGNLNNLFLQPGSTVSIKLGFFNKEMYHQNHIKGYMVL